MARKLLSPEAIASRLRTLTGWTLREKRVERSWEFKDFREALTFINRVGELAEAADHHPDIRNSWNKVVLSLTTHDRGGLTDRDFELAEQINRL